MNTPQGINFDEARETLGKLEAYVNQKIQRKNDESLQGTDMNLASQPKIASDHLGEEKELTPVVEIQQAQNVASENLEGADQTPQLSDEIPSIIEMQSPSPVEENLIQPNPVMPGTPRTENPIMSDIPAGMGVIVGTNQPVSQFVETQPNPNMSGVPAGMGVSVDTNQPVSQFEGDLAQSTSETGPNILGLENIPDINLNGVINQEGASDASSLESTQADEGYKAGMNNATIGYPSEPAPATEPVVMPNGTTQDMSSGDSIVVGPEAFNMTR